MKTNFIIFFLLLSLPTLARTLIIGGEKGSADNGKGIFQIGVPYPDTSNNITICTATKISENIIITAAHCFDKNQDVVRNYYLNTKIENEKSFFDEIKAERVLIHPTYANKGTGELYIDIALVVVKPNDFFRKIDTVEIDFDFVESETAVEFWGYGCQGADLPDNVKKFGMTKTRGKEDLNVGGIKYSNADRMYETHLITFGYNKEANAPSSCPGDSGGPVLKEGKLVGVTEGTIDDHLFNQHTRISIVQDWLGPLLLVSELQTRDNP